MMETATKSHRTPNAYHAPLRNDLRSSMVAQAEIVLRSARRPPHAKTCKHGISLKRPDMRMTRKTLMLSGTQLNSLAEVFRLLGDPNRLRIVMYCMDDPKSVGNIAEKLGLSQTLVSQHLRLLRGARIVVGKRQAKNVFYSVADDHVGGMIVDMVTRVKEGALLVDDVKIRVRPI